jgi:hypothetical protein
MWESQESRESRESQEGRERQEGRESRESREGVWEVSYGKIGRMLISPFFKSDSTTTLRRILAKEWLRRHQSLFRGDRKGNLVSRQLYETSKEPSNKCD